MKRSIANISGEENIENSKWEKRFSDKYQREYWYNLITNQSEWEKPFDVNNHDKFSITNQSINKKDLVWVKSYSERHNCHYWYNMETNEKTWIDPNINITKESIGTTVDNNDTNVNSKEKKIKEMLTKERKQIFVNEPLCPREISSNNLLHLVHRLQTDPINIDTRNPEFKIIFILVRDDTSLITRCIQEDQILKTKLKLKVSNNQVIDLPSFWEVWKQNPQFRDIIINSKEPNEEKWKLQREFNYKIATTFMPGYAKAIYEFFEAETVLDPCAGWGDRMTGAAAASIVKKYVAFDPNHALRPGYIDTMQLFNHSIDELTNNSIHFSNQFDIYSLPFEEGANTLISNSYDLVFTSPPFFDYEMYSKDNPRYHDWIDQFYKPLFIESCRCVKVLKHVCIHIGDTSAGNIELFLKEQVDKICNLKLVFKIGLHGMMSGKKRTVWVFQKLA